MGDYSIFREKCLVKLCELLVCGYLVCWSARNVDEKKGAQAPQTVDKPPQGHSIAEGFVHDGVDAKDAFTPSTCVGDVHAGRVGSGRSFTP